MKVKKLRPKGNTSVRSANLCVKQQIYIHDDEIGVLEVSEKGNVGRYAER